jgi:hypothetical protein
MHTVGKETTGSNTLDKDGAPSSFEADPSWELVDGNVSLRAALELPVVTFSSNSSHRHPAAVLWRVSTTKDHRISQPKLTLILFWVDASTVSGADGTGRWSGWSQSIRGLSQASSPSWCLVMVANVGDMSLLLYSTCCCWLKKGSIIYMMEGYLWGTCSCQSACAQRLQFPMYIFSFRWSPRDILDVWAPERTPKIEYLCIRQCPNLLVVLLKYPFSSTACQ